jgi:glycosyltransferase involved in cell wall biosynthesis
LYFFKFLTKIKADIFISFSPVITSWFFIFYFSKIKKKALFYFDFFPIHHHQINKIKSFYFQKCLHHIESFLVKFFDFVGCMSPKNVDYFVDYFSFNKSKVFEVPLWLRMSYFEKKSSDSVLLKEKLGIDNSDIILLFGGQLEKGRGIDFLCDFAKELTIRKIPATIIVLGKGSLQSKIIDASSHYKKLKYLGSVTKSQYKKFLEVVDVGLAITVDGVNVPTYPSKIIEYSSASLPILASIEKASDLGNIIHLYNAGFVSNSGDMDMFLAHLVKYLDKETLDKISLNSHNLFMIRHYFPISLKQFKKYLYE